ncbi:glycosyltransferase family 2 protein [Flavobacterium psychrophilum]|uniref:glycosyltransferase family 2 protein n=1 Tax=Flavobacterium psychrophilum TaxID=96345 RepID=UPI000B7C1C07|nr:glycosyltransferase family 2 protein [Flavobacterium psychrophilum]EKT4550943.1 glycosyltransferase family 2 protein [Flavobacterium psychrophilum]ELY1991174.1 glycosyltransferase family 2 protein [Flavobacterium psychrophilum]MEB3379310.1 glycosyltransferase family 2 protein [Flavobacterium psychrophilum]SNA69041.1 Glycosyltransferase, group 2 family protein [Flavobacterium psychrophilum]
MRNNLVSIIIPVFNAEKFLDETIKSVLNQTLKEIEIILVNDGSKDNSLEVCEKYANLDARIKIISQENSGVSITRNNGLSEANGNYIYFLDSDDTINKDFIKTSYQKAIENDSDIVILGKYFCDKFENLTALPAWGVLIKHNFLLTNHTIRFPEKIQPCEDGLFSHQLLALTDKISLNYDCEYYYRGHENQNHLIINKDAGKVINQIPKWLEILDDFYSKNNLYSSKSLHLALFLEHEPFEFRYLGMPINSNQKDFLHILIKDFYFKNVLGNITKKEKKKLSKSFLKFLSKTSTEKFDKYYGSYLKKEELKKRFLRILINFIPISKFRKKIRSKYLLN